MVRLANVGNKRQNWIKFLDLTECCGRKVRRNIHPGEPTCQVCPTSSEETGAWMHETSEKPPWSEHPMRRMLDAGASMSINSDDPSVFLTSLIDELMLCISEVGLSREAGAAKS